MVIVIMETVPVSVRGEISKWLIELTPGIFIGTISALVRDQLWELICEKIKDGGATLAHNAKNEQGFMLRQCGKNKREVIDFEGLLLLKKLK